MLSLAQPLLHFSFLSRCCWIARKLACRVAAGAVLLVCGAGVGLASGPHWVAGTTYFDPAAKGMPIAWSGGRVAFYLDKGSLSTLLSGGQTQTMLNQAAAVWNAVPTAAVNITYAGTLNEDVDGSNVTANVPAGTGATFPADAQPTATGKPVGVIMDADGSVIDTMYGTGASAPTNCTQNGVFVQDDNLTAAGNIAHALIILNGRCATTTAQVSLMQYEMVRAFGRVLGLDWSQVNDALIAGSGETSEAMAGWPIMHPVELRCSPPTYNCMANPLTLRLDDIAGLNRLYPVTSANIASFAGKQLTAANTLSVQGTIHFKRGQGMQGVNVVLTPLAGGAPQISYSVSGVSGVAFHGNAGNRISGLLDAQGNSLARFGSDDASLEGFFDLSGVPLPAGQTAADYQLTFEAINPAYVNGSANGPYFDQLSVGPYVTGQVTPSGTMPVLTLAQLSAGAAIVQDVVIHDSADETHTDDGLEATPNVVQANGEWLGRLTGYGHTGWFQFAARANRVFTVEATALDETGIATLRKADVLLGLWDGSDPAGSTPVLAIDVPFNGDLAGLSTLNATTNADGLVRIALADMRGDGRPDFLYRARVLYADSVEPARLASAGGPIVIHGAGFRANAVISVNGVKAAVTSVTPSEITAVAPPASAATGAVALTVSDPATLGTASILDGLSYDAYGSDQIGVMSGPSGSMPEGVPVPFLVRVMAADNVTPAGNVAVTFAVQQGSALLGCGATTCVVTTNGAGQAMLMVTPTSSQSTRVAASLTNGASVSAEFIGIPAPVIAPVTPALYLAIGATSSWQPSAILLNGGTPMAGAQLNWTATSAGISVTTSASTTNSAGIASSTVTAGPLAAGATASFTACRAQSSSSCAPFIIYAVHAELASLTGVSGMGQDLTASSTPAPVALAVTDAIGHPLAGATVNFYEALTAWQPACPLAGRCPATQTLATQSVTVVSDAGGIVTLAPLTGHGVPTTLTVNATTGEQASLVFTVVQHP